jgi:hypothetical protein
MTRVEDEMQPAHDDLQPTQDDVQPPQDNLQPARDNLQPARENGTGRLTTEQIARAADDRPADRSEDRSDESSQPPAQSGPARRAQLLAPEDKQDAVGRWREIQAAFVDEPRQAVTDADALVASLMQQLAQMFAAEREQLEAQWSAGRDVSTEDLRQGLQRYRSFFERLLAA